MDDNTITQLKKELRYFTGSETVFEYFLLSDYCYTEGVKYLAEQAQAYWLVGTIFSHQYGWKVREQPFQVWKLEVHQDDSATLTVKLET